MGPWDAMVRTPRINPPICGKAQSCRTSGISDILATSTATERSEDSPRSRVSSFLQTWSSRRSKHSRRRQRPRLRVSGIGNRHGRQVSFQRGSAKILGLRESAAVSGCLLDMDVAKQFPTVQGDGQAGHKNWLTDLGFDAAKIGLLLYVLGLVA